MGLGGFEPPTAQSEAEYPFRSAPVLKTDIQTRLQARCKISWCFNKSMNDF